jgi:hemolysin activation/secretion protein
MKFKHHYLLSHQTRVATLFVFALEAVFLVGASKLWAQALPNAGLLERGAEQGFKALPQPKLKAQGLSSPELTGPNEGEVSVVVKRFEFQGNQKLSSDFLNEKLSSFLKRPLSFAQLQLTSDEIMNAYRQAGWMVRAYLPKQEIEDGVVKIAIIEGIFGGTQIDGQGPERVHGERLIQMGNAANPMGEAVRAVQLDRALLLMDDLPGVMVSGNLVAGEQTGQTQLSIRAVDGPLVDGNWAVDNSGSMSTGASRLMLSVNLNSPTQMGDLLNVNLLKSEGSNYARLNYALPIGLTGLKAGVHASTLNYNLIGNFASLDAKGSAYTGGLEATYPIIRSQSYNLNVAGSWDHKWYENQANQSVSSKYQIQAGNIVLSGNGLDQFLGGGALNYSLGFTQGQVNLTDSPNALADAQTAQTAGNYSKSNFNLNRLQSVTPNLSVWMNLNVQKANKNLDSSEKIYLGGANGVRAYPSNEGGGSDGQTFSLELRQRLQDAWTLAGFYDYGRVKVYHNNQDVLGGPLSALNDFALRGTGLSLNWQGLQGLDLKVSVAKRILLNPMANARTGADSDGTLRLNRVWFNANLAF